MKDSSAQCPALSNLTLNKCTKFLKDGRTLLTSHALKYFQFFVGYFTPCNSTQINVKKNFVTMMQLSARRLMYLGKLSGECEECLPEVLEGRKKCTH